MHEHHCQKNYRVYSEKSNKVSLYLKTKTSDGLVLWASDASRGSNVGDFFALSVVSGRVEFTFRLGDQVSPTTVISKV